MKNLHKQVVLALLTVSALAAVLPAQAQSGMMQQLSARFASADVDHDGKLTKAEAQAGMPRVAAHFDEIDSAHAGFITLQQIQDFIMKKQ